MSDLLDFPKPKPELTKERTTRDAADEARLLSSVGERLRPDGLTYVASFAVHVYKSRVAEEFVYFQQSTDLRALPEFIANDAVKEQARTLAAKYGHKPPRKVGETPDETL